MIELEHIVKTFEDGNGKHVDAVRDVSLSIQDGEVFGIIGFSGAGKSTLVRTINLLGRPTSGSVKIDGRELTTLSQAELRKERKKIGMIFQHFNLMPSRTVFGNVAFPLKHSGLSKEEQAQKVRKLLAMVDLSDKENAYPSELSGGQKQRVAIARAMANNPSMILADEPTGALDSKTSRLVMDIFHDLHRKHGKTIVLITHSQELAEETQRVISLRDGEIIGEHPGSASGSVSSASMTE